MGLLRRAVKRAIRRVSGGGGPPPSASAGPAPPQRPAAKPQPAEPEVDLSNIECGAQELKERLDAGESPVIVDVRQPQETAGGVIPGAKLIPLGELEQRWSELQAANEIVCYCALGARSLQAAGFLRSKGLFNATSMDGGFVAWRDVGGETVPPDAG